MPQKSYYVVFKTAVGWVGILGSAAGLKRIALPQSSEEKALAALKPLGEATLNKEYFKDLVQRLQAYFNGQPADFPDKLDFYGATDFQRDIWEATRRIPYGETQNYAWVARQIGKPAAARAVGQALGKNPLPIIIPCHRVISSDGKLGGFTGGLAMKKRLLALEKKNSE
jgi:methylated-DNA-[protein]-cysteine S-methyltransferase